MLIVKHIFLYTDMLHYDIFILLAWDF